MDTQALEPLRRIAPLVDAVLISHPDTAHLGALPYAFGTLGMACKVYATLPVHKMGMMFMYDQFLARAAEGDFDLFSLDDVDRAFGAFVPVRYAQHSALAFPTRNANGADGGDGASGEETRGDARGDGSDGSGANDEKKVHPRAIRGTRVRTRFPGSPSPPTRRGTRWAALCGKCTRTRRMWCTRWTTTTGARST